MQLRRPSKKVRVTPANEDAGSFAMALQHFVVAADAAGTESVMTVASYQPDPFDPVRVWQSETPAPTSSTPRCGSSGLRRSASSCRYSSDRRRPRRRWVVKLVYAVLSDSFCSAVRYGSESM